MFTSNLDIKNEAIVGSVEMPATAVAMKNVDLASLGSNVGNICTATSNCGGCL